MKFKSITLTAIYIASLWCCSNENIIEPPFGYSGDVDPPFWPY